jgi:hypothetical protein
MEAIMESLQDLVATTKVAIEMADDALAEARQAKQRLQAKRQRIQEITIVTLERYQLL